MRFKVYSSSYRFAVLADIHANLPALEAVLADIRTQDVNGIIVAGDLIGICPFPCEVVDRLRSQHCHMVLGNAETDMLRRYAGKEPPEWHSLKQMAPARFWYNLLDSQTLQFLATLSEQIIITVPGTASIRVVHGSPKGIRDGIYPAVDPPSVDVALSLIDETVLICGHTHEQFVEQRQDRMVMNPGAVTNASGDIRTQYAILYWEKTQWYVQHRAVTYDTRLVRKGFEERGLLTEGGVIARVMLLSIEHETNVGREFMNHAWNIAKKRGYTASRFLSDSVLDEAETSFDWSVFE
jgi:putative phosphoesterase